MTENANNVTKKPAKKSWFKGVKSEFHKITWPTKEDLVKESAAVVVISVILGALIALLDAAIKLGLDKIIV